MFSYKNIYESPIIYTYTHKNAYMKSLNKYINEGILTQSPEKTTEEGILEAMADEIAKWLHVDDEIVKYRGRDDDGVVNYYVYNSLENIYIEENFPKKPKSIKFQIQFDVNPILILNMPRCTGEDARRLSFIFDYALFHGIEVQSDLKILTDFKFHVESGDADILSDASTPEEGMCLKKVSGVIQVDDYNDNVLSIGSVVYPNDIKVIPGNGVNLRSFHNFYNIYSTELFSEMVALWNLYQEQDPNDETGEVHSKSCVDLIKKIKMPWGGTATYGNFESLDIIHENDAWSRYRIEAEGRDQYLIEDVAGEGVIHLKP